MKKILVNKRIITNFLTTIKGNRKAIKKLWNIIRREIKDGQTKS